MQQFEITWDPLPEPEVEALPEKVRAQMDRIREKAHRHGHDSVIDETEFLYERYPHIACFANWLAMCYRAAGRDREYQALIRRTVEDFPDYLFGRLARAELFLEDFDLDGAQRALGLREHPGWIVPGRRLYHISEVRYYFFLCGKYHLFGGDQEAAQTCLEVLRKLEPESAVVNELSRLCAHPEAAFLVALARDRNRSTGT